MTKQPDRKDKVIAHGAPRDASMKVLAHPPSQFGLSCLAPVVLGTLGPWTWNMVSPSHQHRSNLTIAGVSGFMASVGLAWTAVATFRRSKTPVPHGYRVQTIVSDGVFGLSRNPMYVSMVAGVASLGVALNTWWGAVAALYLAGTLQWRVIPYEEAYLTKR